IGFINNSLSFLTLLRPKTQEVGCGFYLRCICLVSQFSLFIFGLRFAYLLVTQFDLWTTDQYKLSIGTCITLEFLLTILPSIYDWLTVCIACQRTITVVKGAHFDKTLSKKRAKYVVLFVVLIVILSSLHKPFHRHLINDPHSANGHTWCVIKFHSKRLEKFDTCVNIIHLVVPFLINSVTTCIFLSSLTRRKSDLLRIKTSEASYKSVLTKQIVLYKSFIISPFLIVVLELSRLILSFVFACIKYPWQKYLYLVSYLIFSLPHTATLLIFIIPSQTYKQELKDCMMNLLGYLKN
ncbi:unnamed protein product, partial [Didymodactylos carnosus]